MRTGDRTARPALSRIFIPLRLSPPQPFANGRGLVHLGDCRCCPSVYAFPEAGVAGEDFPDERFCIAGFPASSHPSKSVASTGPAAISFSFVLLRATVLRPRPKYGEELYVLRDPRPCAPGAGGGACTSPAKPARQLAQAWTSTSASSRLVGQGWLTPDRGAVAVAAECALDKIARLNTASRAPRRPGSANRRFRSCGKAGSALGGDQPIIQANRRPAPSAPSPSSARPAYRRAGGLGARHVIENRSRPAVTPELDPSSAIEHGAQPSRWAIEQGEAIGLGVAHRPSRRPGGLGRCRPVAAACRASARRDAGHRASSKLVSKEDGIARSRRSACASAGGHVEAVAWVWPARWAGARSRVSMAIELDRRWPVVGVEQDLAVGALVPFGGSAAACCVLQRQPAAQRPGPA